MRRQSLAAFHAAFLVLLGIGVAGAEQAAEPDENGITSPSIATSLPQHGDPNGVRRWLHDHGLTYTLVYTNDVLANVHGGRKRGTIDQGLLDARVTLDFEKIVGWKGLTLYSNVFQIHDTGRIRRDYVGGINTIAAIEAVPTTRLSELWLEQKLLGDTASIRVGQLAADVEFFFADVSSMFLQSDWPTIAAAALPSGGPAYPLSTPGVRLKYAPTHDVALLLAVFNGDPAGPGPGDEQLRNRYGLNFRVRDPAFVIGEAQFGLNQGKADAGLATKLKLGGWAHFGRFEDQRLTTDGRSLADPAGSGVPAMHRGNSGVYAVVSQQLYRPAGGAPDSGVSIFGRASASPSDRNLIDTYVDGGIVVAGLVPGRPQDRFGASVIHARYSDAVRAFDRDLIAFTGIPGNVRDAETNLELTYIAEIVPGWTVQPDVQYVRHPSGRAGRDAKVVGVRSVWRY